MIRDERDLVISGMYLNRPDAHVSVYWLVVAHKQAKRSKLQFTVVISVTLDSQIVRGIVRTDMEKIFPRARGGGK